MTVDTSPNANRTSPDTATETEDAELLRIMKAMNAKLDAQIEADKRASGNRRGDHAPTLAAFIDLALENLDGGTLRTYRSPLRRLIGFAPCLKLDPTETNVPVGTSAYCERLGCVEQHTELGDVQLDIIVRSDLERFATHVRLEHRRRAREKLRQRRFEAARKEGNQIVLADVVVTDDDLSPKIGNSGKEGAITAIAWLFNTATADLIHESPATGIRKPRRVKTRKRSFSDSELRQVVSVAIATASDSHLVELLLWLYLVSGARLGEGLAVRLSDIDVDRQTVLLGSKGGEKTEQPLPLSLIVALMDHAYERGATAADDRIFRNRYGCAISKKIPEQMWDAVRNELGWADDIKAATHSLRKTGAKAVERHAGVAVSDAWLRHAAPTLNGVYTGATLDEVATAVADLTGEPHPLATRPPRVAATALVLSVSLR